VNAVRRPPIRGHAAVRQHLLSDAKKELGPVVKGKLLTNRICQRVLCGPGGMVIIGTSAAAETMLSRIGWREK